MIEHPDRFLSLPEPPYPAYSFTGVDLSPDPRVEVRLEDHYWDRTDAAVVFQRRDRGSGETRYIYHGNDGTSMPWNDTAQLDYIRRDVREAVIETILDVARRFPIIRFDAAMTLAKKHVERLWYPEPGHGGAIPSRAEHSMTKAEFDRAIPEEFWREVVDRVAAEVPDTLLLAEAFWLMEGYFVRTLGMHRVYNSAFMHMLRDETNAEYRLVIKNTLEFDPEILKRYVNFMNNPDEKTAVEQFGKGDKYFGVATLMSTLPGLPMFGHGQIEGFGEKYGMEYRRAYHDESPDQWLVDRHEREIFPLLHRRRLFAEVRDFLLYDLVAPEGHVNEDVFAYSNRAGDERALIVYNNRYADASGVIRESVGFAERGPDGTRSIVRRTLADGLAIHREHGWFTVYREALSGLEHLRSNRELVERGLEVRLGAYGRLVLLDFREVADGAAGQYARLAERLGGRGVPSVEDALRELQLQPVHDALRAVADDDLLRRVVAAATADGDPSDDLVAGLRSEATTRMAGFLAAVRDATGAPGDPGEVADRLGDELAAILSLRAILATDDERTAGAMGVTAAPTMPSAASTTPAAMPTPATMTPTAAPTTTETGAAAGAVEAPIDRADVAGRLLAGDRTAWAALLGRHATYRIGALGGADGVPDRSRAWVDELRLGGVLADIFRRIGLDEGEAWRATDLARLLVRLSTPANDEAPANAEAPAPVAAESGSTVPPRTPDRPDAGPAAEVGSMLPPAARALLGTWLADDDLRRFIRVNRWEGVAWFEQESFEELLGWVVVLDALRGAAGAAVPDVAAGREAARDAADVAAALVRAARRRRFPSRVPARGHDGLTAPPTVPSALAARPTIRANASALEGMTMRRLSVGPHVAAVVAAFALCLAAAPAFAGGIPASREAGTAPSGVGGVGPLATVIPGPTAIIQPNAWFSVERSCTMCVVEPQAGSTVSFTVTAIKLFVIGPWAGYTGKVSFSSTDAQATLPPSYTFTGSGAGKDNGVHDFVVTFRTAGPQTLRVIQVSDPDINGMSDPVTIRAASSHHTAFVAQPVGAAAGSALASQPVVAIRDEYENRTTSTAAVTLSLVPPAGSAGAALTCLGSGTTKSATAGTAVYVGCAVSVAGVGYTMVATSPGLLSGTSAPFTVTSGDLPASVGFSVQPLGATSGFVPTATSGQLWGTQPQVTVYKSGGQPVTSDNATVVTLSIGSGNGTLTCNSGKSLTVVSGLASFSGCSITGSGSYTLLASATNPSVASIAPATSLPFSLGQQSTGLTLSASPVPINPGQTSVVTVQFTDGANQQVALQWKSALSPTYQTVATLTTDSTGKATYTTPPLTFSTTYQAVFAGSGGLAAATSPSYVVGVRRTVTMSPLYDGYKTINRGTKLTYTSKIGPLNGVAVPRGTFQIYQQIDGVWVFSTSATFACDSAGNATFTWTFSKTGNWYVRWRANSDAYNVTAYSPIAKVHVN